MRSFKKIVTSHFFERRFTGISRLLWDWRNTMNNLEFALEMKNKHLASALSQGELARLTHVSRYSIKGKPKVAIDYNMPFVRMVKKYNKHHKENPLPHITPHTLHHTFCTRLASKNMNP